MGGAGGRKGLELHEEFLSVREISVLKNLGTGPVAA